MALTKSSAAIIGATGRYHCLAFSRFIRSFISAESGEARRERWPRALGPNSCGEFNVSRVAMNGVDMTEATSR